VIAHTLIYDAKPEGVQAADMKRGARYLKVYVTLIVFFSAADYALAQFAGPFSFSFATSFLNAVFLAPLRLVGCA
jgi:hypothetical protein